MRKLLWIMYLWPGLPQLWLAGNWAGLAVAFVFVAICNLLLIGSFAWTELIAQNVRTSVWTVGGIVWGVGVVWSVCVGGHRCAEKGCGNDGEAFGEALDHYLKGDLFQAEQVLESLLRANARDLDARLMLATILRHAKRFDEAQRHLDTLVRFDGAAKWEVEIEHERMLLAEARTPRASADEMDALEDEVSTGNGPEDAVADCVRFSPVGQLSGNDGSRTSVARAA
jgi:tetratricopeptide (TPR) repeat protein